MLYFDETGVYGPGAQALPKQLRYVLNYLIQKIQGEAWQVGHKIPSERMLAQEINVARGTIRHALKLLEEAGIIGRIPSSKYHYLLKPLPLQASPSFQDPLILLISRYYQTSSIHCTDVFSRLDCGIVDNLQQVGWNILYHTWKNESTFLTMMKTLQPYGIMIGAEMDYERDLQQIIITLQIPNTKIVVNSNDPVWWNYHRVTANFTKGMEILLQRLIEGYQRQSILLLSEPTIHHRYWMQERIRGYELTIQRYGLYPYPVWIMPKIIPREVNDFQNFQRRIAQMKEILASILDSRPVDAILAISDSDIYTIGESLIALGKDPQNEILIAGWDDYWKSCPEHQWSSVVPVATVNNRLYEIGKMMVQTLFFSETTSWTQIVPTVKFLDLRLTSKQQEEHKYVG